MNNARLNAKQRNRVNNLLAGSAITNGMFRVGNTINKALWHVNDCIELGTEGKFCLDQQTADSFLPAKATRQLAVIDAETGDHYGSINFSYEYLGRYDHEKTDRLEVVAYYAG